MQKLCSPFFLIHRSGWMAERANLIAINNELRKYQGQLGVKHRVKSKYDPNLFAEYEWIIRDCLGNRVDEQDIRDAYVNQDVLAPHKSRYKLRAILIAHAAQKGLPIPFAKRWRARYKATRRVAQYIGHHRTYNGLQKDFRTEGDLFDYPWLKCSSKPNLKHEPYEDRIFSRRHRNWKRFRVHQWRD